MPFRPSECVVDLDWTITRTNSIFCQTLGFSPMELAGTRWTQLAPTDDRRTLGEHMEQLLNSPSTRVDAEERFLRKDGSLIWMHLWVVLARDKDGKPLFLVIHTDDITSRKLSSHELHESEERFRTIADSCPSIMWATDEQAGIQFLNKAGRTFFGVESEEMSSHQWQSMIHPDEVAQFVEDVNLASKKRLPLDKEARFRRADGAWRLLGFHSEPRVSPNGLNLGRIGICADITERKVAENERAFELSLNRSIQAETLEGILVVDGKGIVVSHNQQYRDVLGLNDAILQGHLPESFVGTHIQSLLSEIYFLVEDPDSFSVRALDLYTNLEKEDVGEVPLKDGRTIERHSTGLRGPEGKFIGRVYFFRDITPHKRAEINLRIAKDQADEANRRLLEQHSIIEKEREILRTLIDNVPDFMYVKDMDCKFVLANSVCARAMGAATTEELIGKCDFDYYPRELAKTFYDDEIAILRSGQSMHYKEELNIDGEGNVHHLLTTKVPVRDNNGQIVGIAGIGRDISARKKMEDALRQAEQKYRGIFDKAIVGIFQSSPEGRLLSVNPAMAFAFRYNSPEEMIASVTDISKHFFVDPKRGVDFMLIMDRVGGVKNFECEVYCKDGDKIWITMSLRALRENGEVVRYEGMCEDITERQILREQLLQAQKLESVGQLAAGIAHEINTPTQYINDNVHFLKDAFSDLQNLITHYERLYLAAKGDGLSPDTIHEVDEALQHTDAAFLLEEIPKAIDQSIEGLGRVATLVKAMKEFSHPGTKEKVPVDLNRAIANTITVSRNEWKYVAKLENQFDSSLPLVLCYPGEFNQVILNLIVNAAQAIAEVGKKGGPKSGKITVQTRHLPDWAEVRIEDTGGGIPVNVRNRIFDPFFTTKEIGKGTGQGLAISRSVIVDKHGGSIDFETEEGNGTTFIVRIPIQSKPGATKEVAK